MSIWDRVVRQFWGRHAKYGKLYLLDLTSHASRLPQGPEQAVHVVNITTCLGINLVFLIIIV